MSFGRQSKTLEDAEDAEEAGSKLADAATILREDIINSNSMKAASHLNTPANTERSLKS